MVSEWMLQKFRSAWLSANLPLLVLRLLRVSTSSEWEILSFLNERYGLNPSAQEFQRLERSLLGNGYVSLDPHPGGGRMRITTEGLGLLAMLEEQHRGVVAGASGSSPGSSGVSLR